MVGLLLIWGLGCRPLQVNSIPDRLFPSNDRQWTRDMALLATAEFDGDRVTLHNIRNSSYVTERDFVIDYYDRTFNLDEIRGVDFVVVPFKNMPAVAHTMLSFELADQTYISISVEIRTELGEQYSPMLGVSNQFELVYVVADERDLIRLRTRHRNADVYIYPTLASPEDAQRLFVDAMSRANELASQPEFYNTFTNNCTTNLVSHVNRLNRAKVPFGWKVLLPGYSAQYAYDLGLLDNRIPFEELRSIAHVNNLAEEFFDDPRFSVLIRQSRQQIDRAVEANSRRSLAQPRSSIRLLR